MNIVLRNLTKGLDRAITNQIGRRVEAMTREITYLRDTDSSKWKDAFDKGWDERALEVACSLNAFYQIVVGPLASSIRHSNATGLGAQVPIAYGETIIFNRQRAQGIRNMHLGFQSLVTKARIPEKALQANHGADLLTQLTYDPA